MVHYFAVETKCGHVGKNQCIYIWFAVKAENGKAAAAKARAYKRVKHHHKDAIRQVKEITVEEYRQLLLENQQDPYLHCQNVQQQRALTNFSERIEADTYLLVKCSKVGATRNIAFKVKKNKIRERDAICRLREHILYDEFAS